MNPVSYGAIEPNIGQVDVNGGEVRVTWKCPATGRQVGQSTAYMAADPSISARVQSSVKRSIVSEMTYGVARFVSGLLGGTAGRIVSNATYTAAGDLHNRAVSGADYTEASRQAAIVSAFSSVQASFVWDDGRRQYVGR